MEFLIKKDYIHINLRKYLYVSISNPKKTINKLKGIFKSLKSYFRFEQGLYAPYPVLWVSQPAYVQIMFKDVGWKDKYGTPQFEYNPYIWIHIYKWNFVWYWSLPLHQNHRDDEYWEQALWYLYYSDKDINKAKETWPWSDYYSKKSTWTNKFLIK